ncbi:Na+/H+ antiporter NhaC [Cobetia amphilecti]|uniref:Na+/H+ antiporter NhaC n=1 Tax=Cobetia amphilecti TaxID=1055104 RepID=A0AAP4U1P7_9GAMM|nr:Na+/H+ antiporter NhaC [Cobetia amphilecti]MDO6672956.1 Na+/H+ antiporter NhaC [Cobetia amphilecti]
MQQHPDNSAEDSGYRPPSLLDALIPIVLVIAMLVLAVVLFGADASWGPNQVALLSGAMIAGLIGLKNGYRWSDIEEGINKGIQISLGAILILLAVGAMIGTWILGGTVPAMIYYGLDVIAPQYFYASACLLCALVALSVGSSWTVAGTIGIGLIGIADGLGLSEGITAGAVISGAYFGDKLSPLSDTTNLAPAAAGTTLFAHIRHMLWTTVPSILLALAGFLWLGHDSVSSLQTPEQVANLRAQLGEQFNIGLHLLIPLLVLLVMAVRQMPAFPAIFIGAALGAVFAVIFQPQAVVGLASVTDMSTAMALLKGVWMSMFDGYVSHSGDEVIDSLLSKGGMSSMLNTVWLILSAMTFGGVIERLGLLERLVQSLLGATRNAGSLVITTLGTCLASNVVTGDQYISVILPGRMYRAEFRRRRLAPVNLSRALEDSGTITSPLIPWNSCGAYMAATLGVATLSYLPFALFNLINLALAVAYAMVGFKLERLEEGEGAEGVEPTPLAESLVLDTPHETSESR